MDKKLHWNKKFFYRVVGGFFFSQDLHSTMYRKCSAQGRPLFHISSSYPSEYGRSAGFSMPLRRRGRTVGYGQTFRQTQIARLSVCKNPRGFPLARDNNRENYLPTSPIITMTKSCSKQRRTNARRARSLHTGGERLAMGRLRAYL